MMTASRSWAGPVIAEPVDLYDPAWIEFNEQFPGFRSLGAAAADDGDAGEGAGTEPDDGGSDPGSEPGDGGNDGDAEPDGAGTDDTPAPDDWRSAIKDEKERQFASRFNTPQDMASFAFKTRQDLSNAIKVPGKDASEEDIAKFRKQLGIPDEPSGYKLAPTEDLPDEVKEQIFEDEGGKAMIGAFAEQMHALNAPPAVVQAAVDFYAKAVAETMSQQEAEIARATKEMDGDLKREWGKDAEANDNYALQAARTFGGDGFTEFLENTVVDGVQLGNHPMFRKVFAQIGRNIGEDGFHVAPSGQEAESIQEELDRLFDLQNTDEAKYKSDRTQRRIRELLNRQHGDGPIVGASGRVA